MTQLISQAKKSSAAKQQTGKHIEQELDQLYISRKSRGNQRVVFNDGVNKMPGVYNEKGTVNVSVLTKT